MEDMLTNILKYITEDEEVESTGSLDEFINAGLSVEKGFTEDDADPKELAMGVKVEMEHTTNPSFSKKIALDHLAEIPDYYTRLVAMERDADRDMDEMLGD